MPFCAAAFQVNYCCAVKENKNIWERLFILQWLTKSMQAVIKKCRQLTMGGATCTFWNPFTNLQHQLSITGDHVRGESIFHGENPSTFKAFQFKASKWSLYPLHCRPHRAWCVIFSPLRRARKILQKYFSQRLGQWDIFVLHSMYCPLCIKIKITNRHQQH